MNKKFYCLALGAFLGGIFVSCTNDLNEPVSSPNNATLNLVRAPEVYAWSGNHTFGNGTRSGEEGQIEYYKVMPDFTDWCNSWWNKLNVPEVTIPKSSSENSMVISNDFEANKDEDGVWRTPDSDFMMLTDFTKNTKIYVDGAISFYDSPLDNVKLEFYISKGSEVIFDLSDQEKLNLKNITIYNEGWVYIYDTKESIGEGTTIYNSGELTIEQNYVDDNSDLSLDPIIITQPIYSIGEVVFRGGVKIDTNDTYFKQVCVDGQMTVSEGKTTHTGYLNCDELYCHADSKIEMAPEGAIIAGTISMIKSASISGSSKANGFILTNHIIGEKLTNNGEDGNKMESEVNKGNFDQIFKNVNILVTQIIDNKTTKDDIEEYKPTNGKTIFLGMIPFDASSDDDNFTVSGENGEDYEGVKTLSCGLGYEFIPKTFPDNTQETCDKCKHPKHNGKNCEECEEGEECNPKKGETVVTPELPDGNSEVEVNLAINDTHIYDKKDINDLVVKLSIHVRYKGDVEVFIPMNERYTCESDDLYIIQNHEEGYFGYGGPNELKYLIPNGETVTLTISHEENGIRITTDGVENVYDYLVEEFGDGMNFEVYLYLNKNDEITPEGLKELLDTSTIKFLDEPYPNYYINAFTGTKVNNSDVERDCKVSLIQTSEYDNGQSDLWHLNGKQKNVIYRKNGVNKDYETNEHNHDWLWGELK